MILKTEDGRELTGVDINLFAEGDREYIRKWMDETTPTLDYHFRYEVKTEKIDSTRNKIDSYKTVGASTTAYEVKMTNLSRGHGRTSQGRIRILCRQFCRWGNDHLWPKPRGPDQW